MKQGLRIAIEGNIGVGKSTLLPRLQQALAPASWNIMPENTEGDPAYQRLREAAKQDPAAQLPLHVWTTQRRLANYQSVANDPGNWLFERSFFGELVFCHANMLQRENAAGDYIRFFYDVTKAVKECRYDAVIYLKASPEACFEHIKFRARESELRISLDEVKYLHACFEAHLPATARVYNTPVVTVDWDRFGAVEKVADQLRLALDFYAEKQPQLKAG